MMEYQVLKVDKNNKLVFFFFLYYVLIWEALNPLTSCFPFQLPKFQDKERNVRSGLATSK